MVCDIKTQCHAGSTLDSGTLELSLSQLTHAQSFWRCVVQGESVQVDCGKGLKSVSSRRAIQLLMRELMLRSALGA